MLLAPILVVILTQLFWLSLLLFGYVILHAFYGLRKKPLPIFWIKAPFFARIVLCFAAVCVIYGIWSIIGYALRLPAWWLGASYVATAIFSIVYAIRFLRQKIRDDVKTIVSKIREVPLFSLMTLTVVVISADYLLNLHLGGYLAGDALVHMAKTRGLVENGFSLVDPAFGNVLQSGYIVTIWHTILAVPAFFGLDIVNSWTFSLAPTKLVIVSALYYLGWCILRAMNIKKRALSLLSMFVVLTLLVLPLSLNTLSASYPNRLMVAWVALLVVGLLHLLVQKPKSSRAVLFVSACILIAMTHPLYSTISLLLVALIGGVFLVFGRGYLNKKIVWILFIGGIILASTPIIGMVAAQNATRSAELVAYTSSYSYWHFLGFEAFRPTLNSYVVAIAKSNWWLNILGLVGCGFILYRLRAKNSRLIVGSMLVFVPLIVFNPLTFSLVHKVLPYWAINRFFDVNMIAYLSVSFGVIALLYLLNKKINIKEAQISALLGMICVVFLLLFNTLSLDRNAYPSNFEKNPHEQTQAQRYERLMATQRLAADIREGDRVLASVGDSFLLMAVSEGHIVAVPIGNANPLVDIDKRLVCEDVISKSLANQDGNRSAALMKQIGVDYLLTTKKSKLLPNLEYYPEYFQFVKKDSYNSLFRLKAQGLQPANEKRCVFNE